jgi:lysophospholipase L1-like esterase
MKHHRRRRILIIVGSIFGLLAVFVLVQVLIVKYNGVAVPVPTIPRAVQVVGQGEERLTFAVLGDSTAVGQGGEYKQGIAVSSANYIANTTGKSVALQNFAVSSARVADVLQKQLADALELEPDVVLLAMGANDVTHLTSFDTVKNDTNAIIASLKKSNPKVKIVLTGSPQMGSVPRFVWPVDILASSRTKQINSVFIAIATADSQVVLAPIANDTGDYFAQHPELFAVDKFHPNTKGYAVWNPTLQRAFSVLLTAQRSS